MRRELGPVALKLPGRRDKLLHELLLDVAHGAALVVGVAPKLPLYHLALRQNIGPVQGNISVLPALEQVFQGLAIGFSQKRGRDRDVAEVLVGNLVLVVGRLHRRVAVLVVDDEDGRSTCRLRVPDLFGELAGGGEVVPDGPAVDQHHEVCGAAHLAARGVSSRRRRRREVERRRRVRERGAGEVAGGLAPVGVAVVRVDVDEFASGIRVRVGGWGWSAGEREKEKEK
jgi:hypothetical protein